MKDTDKPLVVLSIVVCGVAIAVMLWEAISRAKISYYAVFIFAILTFFVAYQVKEKGFTLAEKVEKVFFWLTLLMFIATMALIFVGVEYDFFI